jgi:DNA-directed RNA polymerase I subunit RPA1
MGSNYRRQRTEFSKEETIHDEATSISFGVYSANEIRTLSVCEVVNPLSFNQLGHPVPGGLYDLHMGPFSDRGELMCSTCVLHCEHCPGHLGHIELPLPVCNPLFYNTILRMLKMTCVTCHRFRIEDHLKRLYLVQQKLLDQGLIIQAQQASEVVVNASGGSFSFAADEAEEKAMKKALKQNIDTALIVAKLDKFMQEVLAVDSVEDIRNTRSVESLRKAYNKDFLSQNTKSGCCPNCGAMTKTIVFYKSRFIYDGFKINTDDKNDSAVNIGQNARRQRKLGEREKTELNPEELKQHFRELWSWDPEILINLFPMLKNKTCEFPTDLFFVDVLSVPPPKTRPCQYTGGMMTIHPQSTGLQSVVETVTVLKQVLQVTRGKR